MDKQDGSTVVKSEAWEDAAGARTQPGMRSLVNFISQQRKLVHSTA